MTRPVLMVVDDDPGSLGTLDETLRRRYGHDHLVISHASPAAAPGRLRELRAAGHPVAVVMAGSAMTAAPVPLSYEQFRYAFANAVPEDEARHLYETFAVPASGLPLFQAAAANLNPWTEAKVDTENPDRGPMLLISGEKDHTVPWAITNASYKHQHHNKDVTEIVEMPNRGHALTIDGGWREVADTALAFVQRFAPAQPAAA
jgi:pimeloyl-ACP methyl ester carboxylesterase